MQKLFSISRWVGVKRLLSVMFFLCCSLWTMGQGTVTFKKFEVTNQKTCNEDGAIKVHVDNPNNIKLGYKLLYNGADKMISTDGEFKNIGAGQYKVRVAKEGGSPIYFTEDVEVKKDYVPLTASKPKLTLTGYCNTFEKGGKISVDRSSITGGTEPFKYLIYKTDNPNFSDVGMTYGDASEFTVSDFGTYMVRIKDACGEKVTVAQAVPLKLPRMQLRAVAYFPDCDKAVLWTIRLFDPVTKGQISADDYFKAGGLQVELYQASADGTQKVGTEKLFEGVLRDENAKDYKPQHYDYVLKFSPTHKYWGKITTPCGDVYEGPVLDLNSDRRTPLSLSASTTECAAEGKETMTISNLNYRFFIPAGTVKFQNVATGKIEQELRLETPASYYTFKSNPLPLGKYKVWFEHDKCKEFNSEEYYVELSKSQGGKLAFNFNALSPCDGYQSFTYITGTTTVEVKFSGYLPNQKDAVVTIESGPTNVGVKGHFHQYRYRWYNMLPGNYVVKYVSCGQELRFPITVKNDESILRQSIVSKAFSICAAKGRIESSIDCNHYFQKTVQLVDKDDQVVQINGKPQENSSGVFTDLPPGKYRTRLKIKPNCVGPNGAYYVYNNDELTILNSSDDPKFVEAQGIACETLTGAIGTTGTIYLTLAADQNAKLNYRKVGTTSWISIPYSSSVVIPNLEANQSYDFSLQSCGKTATTTVKVDKLGVFVKTNVKHPCAEQPYELKAPRYIGAVYSWRKATGGAELSNSEKLKFTKFTTADNGMYICKLQWGNCVLREFRYYLDASKCGQDITEAVSGTVYNDETDNAKIDGTPISQVDSKPLYIQVVKDNGSGSYTHTGIIKQVNTDGSFLIDGLTTQQKYRLILTTNSTAVNTASPIPYWQFVGEATGSHTTDVDSLADGMLNIVAGEDNQTNLRFGIRKAKPAFLRSNRHITTKL